MEPEERTNTRKHDVIIRRCIMCGQEKVVQPGTEEYDRIKRGEKVAFTCPECDERARAELGVAGGTHDDPLQTL